MEKKFNYFYRIENLINGKFYFGVHGTDILADGYIGSGTRLKYAIRKYGIENFKKEILMFFDKHKEALDYEAEIVNENLVLDPSCYNLKKGGSGGNNGKGDEWYREHINLMLQAQWKDPKFIEDHKKRCFKNLKGSPNSKRFEGKKHSDETILQMRNTHHLNGDQKGFKNSQYGTCWITNEKENTKIHRGDLIPKGWRLGRKIKT